MVEWGGGVEVGWRWWGGSRSRGVQVGWRCWAVDGGVEVEVERGGGGGY